jgi:hypothetical protein
MADFVMTLDEFIAELEKIRGQLDGTVPVRTPRMTCPSGRLRSHRERGTGPPCTSK